MAGTRAVGNGRNPTPRAGRPAAGPGSFPPGPQDGAARSLPKQDVTRDTRMRMRMATRDCGSEIKSCHCRTN